MLRDSPRGSRPSTYHPRAVGRNGSRPKHRHIPSDRRGHRRAPERAAPIRCAPRRMHRVHRAAMWTMMMCDLHDEECRTTRQSREPRSQATESYNDSSDTGRPGTSCSSLSGVVTSAFLSCAPVRADTDKGAACSGSARRCAVMTTVSRVVCSGGDTAGVAVGSVAGAAGGTTVCAASGKAKAAVSIAARVVN